MNHCKAVSVPIMIIRGPKPFHKPETKIVENLLKN